MAAGTLTMSGLYLATNVAADAEVKFVSRDATERQADRNALYKTGDLEAACSALFKLYEKGNQNPIYEPWRSHQRLEKRLATLRSAWPRVLEARRKDSRFSISSRQARLAKRRGFVNSVK